MHRVQIATCDACRKCDRGDLQLSGIFEPIRQPSIYRRGSSIFMEGQAARAVYVVCSGRVKHTLSSPYGKTLLVRFGTGGDLLGLADCLLGNEYRGSATALVDSQVSRISRKQFLEALDEHPELGREVSRTLAREFHTVCECVENVALVPSVKSRLLQFLNRMRQSAGTARRQVAFPYTQEELAEILGCTRETIGRLFLQLMRSGAISRKGATITFAPHFEQIVKGASSRRRNPRCA